MVFCPPGGGDLFHSFQTSILGFSRIVPTLPPPSTLSHPYNRIQAVAYCGNALTSLTSAWDRRASWGWLAD